MRADTVWVSALIASLLGLVFFGAWYFVVDARETRQDRIACEAKSKTWVNRQCLKVCP